MKKKNKYKEVLWFKKVWEPRLQVTSFLCSLEKRSQCLCFVVRISRGKKKKNLPASYLQESEVCMCVCVLTYLCVHSGVSLMPYFSHAWYDQTSDRELLVSLWPLAFLLGGEKRSKCWHSATLPLILWHHKDTDPRETSFKKSSSWNPNIGWYYIKREWGCTKEWRKVKCTLRAFIYGNVTRRYINI